MHHPLPGLTMQPCLDLSFISCMRRLLCAELVTHHQACTFSPCVACCADLRVDAMSGEQSNSAHLTCDSWQGLILPCQVCVHLQLAQVSTRLICSRSALSAHNRPRVICIAPTTCMTTSEGQSPNKLLPTQHVDKPCSIVLH